MGRGEGASRTGSAQAELVWGPGGQRKSEKRGEQTGIYLGGQEAEESPYEKALFTLQEELRAIGVEGVGLTRKMGQRLGKEGKEACPTDVECWEPSQMGW